MTIQIPDHQVFRWSLYITWKWLLIIGPEHANFLLVKKQYMYLYKLLESFVHLKTMYRWDPNSGSIQKPTFY
jgi:hypothetical protein